MKLERSDLISTGLILCLLIPKYNFINIQGYQQGLRFDDFFLIIGLIYILSHIKININILPGGKSYIIFYGIILLYGIISSYKYGVISILLPVRWIEYSVYFMLLFYSSFNIKSLRKLIIIYISINGIVVILQHYGLIGGIHSQGYKTDLAGSYSGITGGSWELPIILSLFIIPIISDYSLGKIKKILLLIISAILIYYSGSRTGMIGFLFICFIYFFIMNKISLFKISIFGLICIAFINNRRAEYYTKIGDISMDGSLVHRLQNWYLNYSQMQNYDYLWGMGVGATGLYVDGMYAKIFFDMGLLGLLLFCIYYYKFLNPYKLLYLVVLLFSFTLDIFTASKIMYSFYIAVYYLLLIKKSNYYLYRK